MLFSPLTNITARTVIDKPQSTFSFSQYFGGLSRWIQLPTIMKWGVKCIDTLSTTASLFAVMCRTCPRHEHCMNRSKNLEVTFQKGRGFTTPVDYFIACYEPKIELFIETCCRRMIKSMHRSSQTTLPITPSKREEIYVFVHAAHSSSYRARSDRFRWILWWVSCFTDHFSRSYFTQVLFYFVVLV